MKTIVNKIIQFFSRKKPVTNTVTISPTLRGFKSYYSIAQELEQEQRIQENSGSYIYDIEKYMMIIIEGSNDPEVLRRTIKDLLDLRRDESSTNIMKHCRSYGVPYSVNQFISTDIITVEEIN